MSQKYFKTIYAVTVLSEKTPFSVDLENENILEQIHTAISEGDCIGEVEETAVEELSTEEMRDALVEAGNDGSFFPSLDEEDEEESEVPTNEETQDLDSDPEERKSDNEEAIFDDADEYLDLDGDEDITEDA